MSRACTLREKLLTSEIHKDNSYVSTEGPKNNDFDTQTSDVIGAEVSKAMAGATSQNVHFIDGDEPWSYNIKAFSDETTQLAGYQDAGLGSFLSRPVKIREYQWTPGTRLFEIFNPWKDFFGNPDVLDKINRFRNLRCNLKVKVLINGNSFYYGRALLSYNPFILRDQVTKNRSFYIQDLVQASQKPHILIDPTTSQGGELTLPFIWPTNYVDITYPVWEEFLGRMTIHDFDVLQHANGGTDPISVVVFAWAENVTLAIPTTASAQAGVEQGDLDEYGFPKPYEKQASTKEKGRVYLKSDNTSTVGEFATNGLVSKPASALAKVANSMSMVPVLGPYAKATSLVASGMSDIARLLGYSRPNCLEDTRAYVPRYMGNMVNSDAAENLVKLSLDSKNELSVDTRIMGLGGEDEMTINGIASRMSFWRQFDWPESAVTDTLLTSFVVEPSYLQTLSAAPVKELHPTALAFAATPFDFWQGSIKFRFNVVCSEYHRGRLRIVFNPKPNPIGPVPYNQVYSTTVDISENRDFEYEVKWAEQNAWQFVRGIEEAANATLHDDALPIDSSAAYSNGTLSVYVVNELATPSTTAANVKVQVWVAAGSDFAVASPTQKHLRNLSLFQQQSEIAPVLATSTDSSNAPCCSDQIGTFGATDYVKDENQYLVYHGERIKSFREVLRRYQYHNSYFPADIGAGDRMVAYNITDFPFLRGWEAGGQDRALTFGLGSHDYNYCSMLLLNYLTPAFACRRGTIRRKANLVNSDGGRTSLYVTRNDPGGTANNSESYNYDALTPGERRKELQKSARVGISGTHVSPASVNPCIEYETAFYTDGQRFLPGRFKQMHNASELSHQLSVDIPSAASSRSDYRIDTYVSIAEDFQLGMFVGAPVLYAYPDPTPITE